MLEKTFLILQENLRDFFLELVVPVSRWMFSGPDLLERERDEEVCIKWDDNADKDFSHHMTESEYFRYKQNWWISLNKTGNTGPLRKRSDFNQVLSTLDRLHHESRNRKLRPMPYWKNQECPRISQTGLWVCVCACDQNPRVLL